MRRTCHHPYLVNTNICLTGFVIHTSSDFLGSHDDSWEIWIVFFMSAKRHHFIVYQYRNVSCVISLIKVWIFGKCGQFGLFVLKVHWEGHLPSNRQHVSHFLDLNEVYLRTHYLHSREESYLFQYYRIEESIPPNLEGSLPFKLPRRLIRRNQHEYLPKIFVHFTGTRIRSPTSAWKAIFKDILPWIYNYVDYDMSHFNSISANCNIKLL